MTIWMCEDKQEKSAHFGKTRRDAAGRASSNRGYDSFARCFKDGWLKKPVKFNVPPQIGGVILRHEEGTDRVVSSSLTLIREV